MDWISIWISLAAIAISLANLGFMVRNNKRKWGRWWP